MRHRKQTPYNILQIARKQKHGSHADELNFKFIVLFKHTILISAYTSSKHFFFQLITHPLIVILHSTSGTKIQQNLNPKTSELVINLNNNRTLLPKIKKQTFAHNTESTSH